MTEFRYPDYDTDFFYRLFYNGLASGCDLWKCYDLTIFRLDHKSIIFKLNRIA